LILGGALGWSVHKGWELAQAEGLIHNFITRLIGLALFTAAGSLVYFSILRLLRVQAVEYLMRKFKQKRLARMNVEDQP
jgi:hypothetical protein